MTNNEKSFASFDGARGAVLFHPVASAAVDVFLLLHRPDRFPKTPILARQAVTGYRSTYWDYSLISVSLQTVIGGVEIFYNTGTGGRRRAGSTQQTDSNGISALRRTRGAG
jgi:hypothetical protein